MAGKEQSSGDQNLGAWVLPTPYMRERREKALMKNTTVRER